MAIFLKEIMSIKFRSIIENLEHTLVLEDVRAFESLNILVKQFGLPRHSRTKDSFFFLSLFQEIRTKS